MLTTSRPVAGPSTSAKIGGTKLERPSHRSFALPRIKVAASSLFNRTDARVAELRQHNYQRGAGRLPEPVLRQIFELCAATSIGRPNAELSLPSPSLGHGRSNSGVGAQSWSWVMLSYVCHTWRKAALDYPELWRYIDWSHPRWTAITLQRAKMQTMCIHAVVGRHNLQSLHRTLQLAHRIGSIQLDSSLHHIHGLLATLAHPNPYVESITVRVNTAGHGVEGLVYPLPSYPLVGPELPSMRYLELHSAPFWLISDRYVSLQDLHVHDLTPGERPTVHQFMCTLSKFKALEHLSLDNAFPLLPNSVPFPHLHSPPLSPNTSPYHSPSSSPPSCPPPLPPAFSKPSTTFKNNRVSLPNLSSLRLTGTIAEITTVLDCLTLPPNISLTCVITDLSDWQQSMHKLTQALNAHSWACATSGFPIETLVMSGLESDAYPASNGMTAHAVTPLTAKAVRIRGFSSGRKGAKSTARARSPGPECSSASRASDSRAPVLDLTIGPDSDPKFSTDEVIVGCLTSVWKALTLGNVQTLVLHDMDFVTQKTWTVFLRSLPSLRVLDITGYAPSGFMWALLLNAVACIQREERERERREKREKKLALLSTQPDRCTSPDNFSPPMSPTSPLTPAPSSSRALFVPKLADVYLHGVDCSTGGYMVAQTAPINSHGDLDDSRFLDVLLACLQMRLQASAMCHGPASPTPSDGCASAPLSATFTLSLGSAGLPSTSQPGSPQHFTLMPTQNKLRSVSLANCKHVPRSTAILLGEFVLNCVWDQKGMLKLEEDTGVASYRKVEKGEGGDGPKHFHRLKRLLDEVDL